jgi:hypothetical protein
MNRRSQRVQRLVRLNQFHQDRASSTLRDAISEQVRAARRHDEAVADLERVGELKPQVLLDEGVDLARYEVILAMERAAIAAAHGTATALAEGDRRREQARDGLVQAATSTRVARQRGRRTLAAERAAEEKRVFDRMAELRTHNPGEKP